MRNIIFIILGIVLIGAGIFFGRDYMPSFTSSQGQLRIASQPEVTVFIDGETKEKTPFSQKIAPGQYQVKLLPDDQATVSTWEQTVTVNPGTETYIDVTLSDSTITSSWEIITLEKLESDETEVSISSDTSSAEIYFDGEFKGTVPLSFQDISAGEHEIRLTAPGFAEKKITVDVAVGYKLSVRAQLALVDESKIEELTERPDTENGSDSSVEMVLIVSPDTGWLRVRSEPSRSGEEIGRVDDDQEYVLISEEDEWYEIEYEAGESGWISTAYAEKVNESQTDQESTDTDEQEEEDE